MLIGKLKVETFFVGNIICQQGDVNNKMYFIHKGIVEVLSIEKDTEILINELYEMDCFGTVRLILITCTLEKCCYFVLQVQGLYMKYPHNFTFKAKSVCVILSLELKKWILLLRYFPSARYEIYEKAIEIV